MAERPPEREDLDSLLESLLPLAQEHLGKYGEFFPFGGVMMAGGDIRVSGAYTGSEHPPSQEVIDLLLQGMRTQAAAGEIRAAAICFDARTRGADGKPSDAIAASLEHAAGDTVLVSMPYSTGRLSGLQFGDLTAGPGQRRVFGPVDA